MLSPRKRHLNNCRMGQDVPSPGGREPPATAISQFKGLCGAVCEIGERRMLFEAYSDWHANCMQRPSQIRRALPLRQKPSGPLHQADHTDAHLASGATARIESRSRLGGMLQFYECPDA